MLNQPGHQTTASIVAEVENRPPAAYNERHSWGPDATLAISDCDRKVSFDFEFGDAESHANNLHKVDTMIDALKAFRRGLATEQGKYERSDSYKDDR